MQNDTQKNIAGIQTETSRQNTKDQVYAENEMLAYHQKESTAQAESRAGCDFLDALRRTSELDWTFLSPSAQFVPGERTGVFRIGADTALRDASGRSWISYEDYAVALVDEIEQPRHSMRRFTVGY